MSKLIYLVFGDLHGRILPAFRLAMAWARDHKVTVAGILQVGDLSFFPDPGRLDRATAKHAARDPLELGASLVAQPSSEADSIFDGEEAPPEALWFTAGNHEDHDLLERLAHGAGPRAASFPVDHYLRVRCVRDGHVETLPGLLRVGALWGIDDKAPRARRSTSQAARIRPRSATQLACAEFDVLLTHESPRDAVLPDSGSEEIDGILRAAQPAFAFFGHYGSGGGPVPGRWGKSQVFRLGDFALNSAGGSAEEGSVGALTWEGGVGEFVYLEGDWLRTFTRRNWKTR
ncbi:MAG: metallophosphoesterase [Gemmataceae bacterium]|nr:metallophosphoesterase [Gemmataceae bacterium]